VALWNDSPVEQIPGPYKEELCISLIEATLQVREDIYAYRQGDDGKDVALVNL
jgi:hypothetical protein